MQYVNLLLAVRIFFTQFQFCLQCGGDVFFNVYFMFARNFFSLRCYLFVKAVYPVGHRILYPCLFEISFSNHSSNLREFPNITRFIAVSASHKIVMVVKRYDYLSRYKGGPDQLGSPVRVGSTLIDSDGLGSSRIMKKT